MAEKRVPASGITVIDEGHSNLAHHIEEIVRHWKMGCADGDMERLVRSFRDAALRHFEEEIAVLLKLGAAIDEHRRAHSSILQEIDQVLDATLHQKGHHRWFGLVEILERMLFDHEILEDSLYYGLIDRNPA